MKIVSGHQPVYLPWLGLFHKLSLSDVFVYMDTVQYLTKDWNNRNKIKTPHGEKMLSVPIDKKKTTGKMLNEIVIKSDNQGNKNFWQKEHFRTIETNYKKTPYFKKYAPEFENMYLNKVWEKLVDLCWSQFELFRKWLHLDDIEVVRMSEHSFEGKKDDLVLDHCIKLNGTNVVFGIHGKDYADVAKFRKHNIGVYFQNYNHPQYKQRFSPFTPYMSVIDLIFNYGEESMEIINSGNTLKQDLVSNNKYWE